MNVNLKILKLVSAFCAALLVIIVIEWLAAKYAQSRLLASIETPAPVKPALDQVPEVNLEENSAESYADLVTRPLFLKGRKPVDESSPEKEKEQLGSETFDWRLDGIYTGKKGLSALLSRFKEGAPGAPKMPVVAGAVSPAALGTVKSKSDNFRRVAANEDVDGWRLTQIKPDRVVFELGGESKTLVLLKPKPKELPPEQQKNQTPRQNNGLNPDRARSRAQNLGKLQDQAMRRRLNMRQQQAVDAAESEEPAVDESENDENNEQ